MAFEPFGLVGGLSVGIPPIVVIDDNGIATLNGLTVTGITNLGPTGNIIITGARDMIQINEAYDFLIKVLEKNASQVVRKVAAPPPA